MEVELPTDEAVRTLRVQALLREAISLSCENCGADYDLLREHGHIVVAEVDVVETKFVFCSYKCLRRWYA